ncbi:hypothetical protein [Klebsiella aerogenes EA1509E]|nr:hypothetical protein [Klebsiella aerogenes EA1509E]
MSLTSRTQKNQLTLGRNASTNTPKAITNNGTIRMKPKRATVPYIPAQMSKAAMTEQTS